MRSGPLCFVIATTFKRFIWSDLVWVSGDTQQDCTMGIPNHCHAGAAALVAAGLLLTACGQSNSSAGSDAPTPPAEPVACPEPGDLTTAAEVLADRLPDEALLEIWQRRMVERGPRFTGSPALAARRVNRSGGQTHDPDSASDSALDGAPASAPASALFVLC